MGKNQITNNFKKKKKMPIILKTHNKFTYFIGIFHVDPYGFVCDIAVRLRVEYWWKHAKWPRDLRKLFVEDMPSNAFQNHYDFDTSWISNTITESQFIEIVWHELYCE